MEKIRSEVYSGLQHVRGGRGRVRASRAGTRAQRPDASLRHPAAPAAMTPEEGAERVHTLLENTGAAYRLLVADELDVEWARAALELLQLQADLIDLYDGLARRSMTR